MLHRRAAWLPAFAGPPLACAHVLSVLTWHAPAQVLTGEMEPTTGTVWKHPNMRFAYVAQHAFHHIEQHLDKTPNQYIQWRYATGEDRENLVKVGRVVTDAEQAAMEKLVLHDGVKKQVDKLLSRCACCESSHPSVCQRTACYFLGSANLRDCRFAPAELWHVVQ